MAFSETQKSRFISLLEAKGWQMRDGTLWSASGGLWLDDSHFEHWSPSEMCEKFRQRAERVAKAQIGDWQSASREHQEASMAAQKVANL
jgi:hypothetical protein